jgi:nitrogenase subunit NifH
MMDFTDFFNSKESSVVTAAQLLDKIVNSYKDKSISQDEYRELSIDVLVDFKKVIDDMSDMETKQILVDAYNNLTKIYNDVITLTTL